MIFYILCIVSPQEVGFGGSVFPCGIFRPCVHYELCRCDITCAQGGAGDK